MRDVIGQASVLGFVPIDYPAGIVMGEVWRNGRMERMTGLVKDIEADPEWWAGRYFWGDDAVERATSDLLSRAVDWGVVPDWGQRPDAEDMATPGFRLLTN